MNKLTKLFEPDGPSDQLISYFKLRKIIGLLGISLPFLLLIFQPLINCFRMDNPVDENTPIQFHYNDREVTMNSIPNCIVDQKVESVGYGMTEAPGFQQNMCINNRIPDILDTISEYHEFYMRDVFVGILCILSAILFTYKGEDGRDNLLSYAASFFAAVTALAPCYVSTFNLIHLTAAFLLFITFGLFCFIVFIRQVPINIQDRFYYLHRAQRRTYRVCGTIIFGCLLGCVLIKIIDAFNSFTWFLFYLETVMLLAFGVSWLTSGRYQYDKIKSLYDERDRKRAESLSAANQVKI